MPPFTVPDVSYWAVRSLSIGELPTSEHPSNKRAGSPPRLVIAGTMPLGGTLQMLDPPLPDALTQRNHVFGRTLQRAGEALSLVLGRCSLSDFEVSKRAGGDAGELRKLGAGEPVECTQFCEADVVLGECGEVADGDTEGLGELFGVSRLGCGSAGLPGLYGPDARPCEYSDIADREVAQLSVCAETTAVEAWQCCATHVTSRSVAGSRLRIILAHPAPVVCTPSRQYFASFIACLVCYAYRVSFGAIQRFCPTPSEVVGTVVAVQGLGGHVASVVEAIQGRAAGHGE